MDNHPNNRGNHERALFEQAYIAHTGESFDAFGNSAPLILRIFDTSHALAEQLIRHPEWAHQLMNDPYISARKPRDVMESELERQLEGLGDDSVEVMRRLRYAKYREMIRIVAREIEGTTPEAEILHEWSDLADLLIAAAYRIVHDQLMRDRLPPCTGTVIALGKLGGQELNLSSDVDLLFLYDHDDHDLSPTPHEFFVRLAKRITDLLNRTTEDGFVFRVDHDLRPEGAQGTLANSLDAAERYYEYFGQDWERQALIRARPVAGDLELGHRFIERIRPFVFRKTLGMNDLIKMRRLKERMGVTARKDDVIEIKMGNGGIRAVEFLVQALQMIYGGRIIKLQEQNTFRAIECLANERLIHPTSAARLKKSYAFLRRAENMLQIEQEQQIYSLRRKKQAVDKLGQRMGYPRDEISMFEHDLSDHMARVHRLFVGMFEADYERIELKEAIEENLATCTDDEELRDSIPWFKHQELRRIQHLDLEGKIDLAEVLRRLTLVAEVVIETAWKMAWQKMTERYGNPRDQGGLQAGFAVIGMGKLGSGEIDYGSDLDLCFIYSDGGTTDGDRGISNAEFFTRLAQRITSLISVASRYGRAYEVDSELRPSGGSGMLVSTLDAFIDHHRNRAQPWERLALLRARVIAGHPAFTDKLAHCLTKLAFEQDPPHKKDIKEQERNIRSRIDDELLREEGSRYDLKYGPGGIHDLESIIHYRQLIRASSTPQLRHRNTFAVLDSLGDDGTLKEALTFYRLLLSRVRLFSGHSTNLFDAESTHANAIAESMGYDEVDSLIAQLKRHRNAVSSEYKQIFS